MNLRSLRVKKTNRKSFTWCFSLIVVFFIVVVIYVSKVLKVVGPLFFEEPKCTSPNHTNFSLAALERAVKDRPLKSLRAGGSLRNNANYENSYSHLPRVTSREIKDGLIRLLEDFIALLEKHQISYFMSQGMLLGSFFFHDLIPWDDDIDLMVDIKDINKLRAMFREDEISSRYGAHSFHDPVNMYADDVIGEDIPTSNTLSCGRHNPGLVCHQQGKIYYKTSQHAGQYEWRYPFVDFIFYATNATHMYNHELWSRDGRIEIPLGNFYPFHLRPYNRLWVPAPRKPLKFLRAKFGNFQCKQSFWNHKDEHRAYFSQPYLVKCSQLKNCYAHVRRRPAEQEDGSDTKGKVVEELVIGNHILQSVILDEEYEAEFDLTFSKE